MTINEGYQPRQKKPAQKFALIEEIGWLEYQRAEPVEWGDKNFTYLIDVKLLNPKIKLAPDIIHNIRTTGLIVRLDKIISLV